MRIKQFKCELLSDVIINQVAATEGKLQTLTFIPGSNFLGIAASIYDELPKEWQIIAYHSGKVRFGDAHSWAGRGQSIACAFILLFPQVLR